MNVTDVLTAGHDRDTIAAGPPPAERVAPAILSLATSTPRGRYAQREIYDMLARRWESYRHPRIEQVFMEGDIEYRHLHLDVAGFTGRESIDEMHERFVAGAAGLGRDAIGPALDGAGLTPAEIDFLAVATCTGYVCPGLGSHYAREFGFPSTLQRAELVGMGCAGAMPAMQRAFDFVRSNPGKRALVVAVEVCSACYYLDDSLETIIGNAICADGAAAMVVAARDAGSGPETGGGTLLPRIVGFRTLHDTAYIDKVGFRQQEGRLRIVLSKDLRDSAGGLVGRLVDDLLREQGLRKEEISHWILHPGGRRIIDAVRSGLGLTEAQVRHSKWVLRNFGNMSSPTVLFVLDRTLRPGPEAGPAPRPGDTGVMIAMGPGLAVEGALLRW